MAFWVRPIENIQTQHTEQSKAPNLAAGSLLGEERRKNNARARVIPSQRHVM